MNKVRRQEIAKVQQEIVDALGVLDSAKETIETLRDEEQEYLDNMPESLQTGDKGQAAEGAIEALDEVVSALDDVISAGIEDRLNDAQE